MNLDTIERNTQIVIVGAGIAGLAAAKTLEESDFTNYILIEAQPQVGGRISSIPWNDGYIETGAQFLHGLGSELAGYAKEKNFLSDIPSAEGEGLYLREDGTEIHNSIIKEINDDIIDVLEECQKFSENNENKFCDPSESIGTVLNKHFQKYLDLKGDVPGINYVRIELFDWYSRYLVIDNACQDLQNLSLKSWGKYMIVSGPELNIFKSHYGLLVESILENLNPSNIMLSSAVRNINWNQHDSNGKKILVTLDNGKKISANCALVTCSLGFLKDNYKHFFSPTLPKRYSLTIETMGFGLINKIFLGYEEPWWEAHIKGFQFLWTEDKTDNKKSHENLLPSWTRDMTGFDILGGHNAVLLGWVGGKGAKVIENLSIEQIIKDSAELLRHFLKNPSLPEATKCLRTCWGTNDFIKGAYCYIDKKCDIYKISPATLSEPIWKTIKNGEKLERYPILMLAGEATHENFYSTTHGAYDTGKKQAQIFLKHIK